MNPELGTRNLEPLPGRCARREKGATRSRLCYDPSLFTTQDDDQQRRKQNPDGREDRGEVIRRDRDGRRQSDNGDAQPGEGLVVGG